MATTTPNFGWDIPQSTDLVKDGATAIAALGNDIDTSMVDLKGGTTGQVLSKASNTDMDFTWVAQDDSNAIQNTIVDAKGDIITATAADTPARLAVGSNGYTLVADSSAATGLAYGSSALVNPVINGGMDIWQRGTSVAVSGSAAYTFAADRWGFFRGTYATGLTVSRQATGDTTNLPNIQYAQRVQRNSGNTSTQGIYLQSTFESVNSIPFAGRQVTFSFYARAGANYSATSNALTYSLASGTGTDQSLLSGFTGSATPVTGTATLTTNWQRFSGTGTISSSATQLGIGFDFTPTGTASTNDWYEVTGVQIDLGSTALPFRRSGGTIQGELAACQRYYWRKSNSANANPWFAMGVAYGGGTAVYTGINCPVTMRISPTSLDYSSLRLDNGGSAFTISSFAISTSQSTADYLAVVIGSTGLTSGNTYNISGNGTGNYIGASAEL